MAELNVGKLTQIVSAVIDIKFPEGKLPEINEAINVPLKDGGKLVVEVAQHQGDDTVRCIAMGPTDGLVRGMEAHATGAPISVPVGEATLGRIFNVLGEPIDEKPAPEGVRYDPIHRKAPAFDEQSTEKEILENVNKLDDATLRTILILRYLNFRTWEMIACKMNYSYMQICRLHSKALNLIKDVIECYIAPVIQYIMK